MADTVVLAAPRAGNKRGLKTYALTDFSNAAITTGTKYEWIIPCYAQIKDVICDSETAGVGPDADIIDVNINGTTIFTTQASRPTLNSTNTGLFKRGKLELTKLVPGDVVSYAVDQVSSGAGSQRFKIAITLEPR